MGLPCRKIGTIAWVIWYSMVVPITVSHLAKISKTIYTTLERKRDIDQDGYLFIDAGGQNYTTYIPAIFSKWGEQTKEDRGHRLSLNGFFFPSVLFYFPFYRPKLLGQYQQWQKCPAYQMDTKVIYRKIKGLFFSLPIHSLPPFKVLPSYSHLLGVSGSNMLRDHLHNNRRWINNLWTCIFRSPPWALSAHGVENPPPQSNRIWGRRGECARDYSLHSAINRSLLAFKQWVLSGDRCLHAVPKRRHTPSY